MELKDRSSKLQKTQAREGYQKRGLANLKKGKSTLLFNLINNSLIRYKTVGCFPH